MSLDHARVQQCALPPQPYGPKPCVPAQHVRLPRCSRPQRGLPSCTLLYHPIPLCCCSCEGTRRYRTILFSVHCGSDNQMQQNLRWCGQPPSAHSFLLATAEQFSNAHRARQIEQRRCSHWHSAGNMTAPTDARPEQDDADTAAERWAFTTEPGSRHCRALAPPPRGSSPRSPDELKENRNTHPHPPRPGGRAYFAAWPRSPAPASPKQTHRHAPRYATSDHLPSSSLPPPALSVPSTSNVGKSLENVPGPAYNHV